MTNVFTVRHCRTKCHMLWPMFSQCSTAGLSITGCAQLWYSQCGTALLMFHNCHISIFLVYAMWVCLQPLPTHLKLNDLSNNVIIFSNDIWKWKCIAELQVSCTHSYMYDSYCHVVFMNPFIWLMNCSQPTPSHIN